MTPEEALRHALLAEVARVPSKQRPHFDGNIDSMAASMLGGSPENDTEPGKLVQALRFMSEVGHPDFEPHSAVTPSRQTLFNADADRQLKKEMLKDYRGVGWTPDQLGGRTPEPYELSPGAKMKSDIEERQRLFSEMDRVNQGGMAEVPSDGHFFSVGPSAWMGVAPNPQIERQALADNYERAVNRTQAPGTDLINQFANPENSFGTFVTKMGPVLSDGWSQAGSNALDGNPDSRYLDGMGDAGVRSRAADWNRTSPALAADRGWEANDKLVKDMRAALLDSEGMSASDTVTAMNGGKPLPWGLHGAASMGMSFLNGLGDMSSLLAGPGASMTKGAATQLGKTGIPGVAQYGRHIARTIGKDMDSIVPGMLPRVAKYSMREMGDELLDPGTIVYTAANAVLPKPPEAPDQFNARLLEESQRRNQAIRTLDSNQDQVIRPRKQHGIVGNLLW